MSASVRRVALGVAVAAALASSACAAGQHASTANELPTLDGINGSVGPINLRGLNIAAPTGVSFPAGSNLSMKLVIVNNGQRADKLTSITSPAFSGWRASSSTAAASSATATPTPASAPSQSVQIAPGLRKSWATPESTGALLLMHTKHAIYPGTTIGVTFTFARAGSITLAVPIALTARPNTAIIPEPTTSSLEG